MQKLSHNDLINLLEFFSKGRQEIVAPFTMKDYEWRELTFKYERNQEAFNIVRARHFAMWLDSQFIALQKVEVSDKAKEKAVRLLGSMLDSKVSDIDSSLLKHHLLIKKMQIIQEFFNFEEKAFHNKIKLLATYYEDKALFEREFKKYEAEIANSFES